jgi:hypothetical protein
MKPSSVVMKPTKKVGDLVQHFWTRQVGVVVEIAMFIMHSGTQWAQYKVHWCDGGYGTCVGSEIRKVTDEGR